MNVLVKKFLSCDAARTVRVEYLVGIQNPQLWTGELAARFRDDAVDARIGAERQRIVIARQREVLSCLDVIGAIQGRTRPVKLVLRRINIALLGFLFLVIGLRQRAERRAIPEVYSDFVQDD